MMLSREETAMVRVPILIGIAACGLILVPSGFSDATARCAKESAGDCRDTNAGTARVAKGAKHTIKSPRDAASGQATGKRTHKPVR
jgi:hypothetical protein